MASLLLIQSHNPVESPDPILTTMHVPPRCLLQGACQLIGSLPQVLCPCYSAMSSLGSHLTSWTRR